MWLELEFNIAKSTNNNYFKWNVRFKNESGCAAASHWDWDEDWWGWWKPWNECCLEIIVENLCFNLYRKT